MSKKRKPYKTYTKEFKLEAVRLMRESNRPAAEIAMELGIRRNQLYKWYLGYLGYLGTRYLIQGYKYYVP